MYNVDMKKVSVLLFAALLLFGNVSMPAQAGIFAEQKARIEQNRINKSTINNIKNVNNKLIFNLGIMKKIEFQI